MPKPPLEQLEDVTKLASQPGNYDATEYHWGMANGLILALHIMRDLHDQVPYLGRPEKWLRDETLEGAPLEQAQSELQRLQEAKTEAYMEIMEENPVPVPHPDGIEEFEVSRHRDRNGHWAANMRFKGVEFPFHEQLNWEPLDKVLLECSEEQQAVLHDLRRRLLDQRAAQESGQ